MSVAAADLVRMVRAVEILAADRFLVDGEPVVIAASAGEATSQPGGPADPGVPRADADPPAARRLAEEIYARLYTRAGPLRDPESDPAARRQHLALLSRANQGRGTWEPGWTVRAVEPDGRLSVLKDGLAFWVGPDRVRRTGEIAPGACCQVWVGKELKELQPGFYIAIGDGSQGSQGSAGSPGSKGSQGSRRNEGGEGGEGGEEEREPPVRLYWHLTAAGAASWMARLTGLLNAAGIPFRAKALSDPGSYRRADAGVLYLAPDRYEAARRAVAATYREIRGELRPAVPLLARRLAPGLAVAEDPGNGESFGQHRCRLVARGLWRAFEAGRAGAAERLESVVAELRREGLDPCRPHLGPGSAAVYRPLPRASVRAAGAPPRAAAADDFLGAARRLGDALCGAAWWHEERCGWMGRSMDESPWPQEGIVTPTAVALGGDLYGGTAGVALFLAQLHAVTGEETYRRTSRGALLQALGQMADAGGEAPSAPAAWGFFDGLLGVAWAARRIARLLDADDLGAAADRLLARALEAAGGEHPLDLMTGSAGAVLVLLCIARDPLWDPSSALSTRALATAVALGEELCRTAEDRDGTWSWPTLRASGVAMGPVPLTGLAHGAAGMGMALLELFAATGREEFRLGARRAFAYEDRLFDRERGNWPDLREAPAAAAGGEGTAPGAGAGSERTAPGSGAGSERTAPGVGGAGRPARYGLAWCHGAPGIALARLRALEIDPDGAAAYRPAATAGLATTARAAEQALATPGADASLCHGLTGLAEVLWTGGRILGKPRHQALAVKATRELLARHGARGDWPSGAPSRGPNPSLMLGDAGVGYWLLRLHEGARVPSVLLPGGS